MLSVPGPISVRKMKKNMGLYSGSHGGKLPCWAERRLTAEHELVCQLCAW